MPTDRIRSWARQHASARFDNVSEPTRDSRPILNTPHHLTPAAAPTRTGRPHRNQKSSRDLQNGAAQSTDARINSNVNNPDIGPKEPDPQRRKSSDAAAITEKTPSDSSDPAITPKVKPSLVKRGRDGSFRFLLHTKEALTYSWVNLLLLLVPVGIAARVAGLNPAVVFALNAVSIIPLAGLLTHATESVAVCCGDTLGALLNISFGNAVELILFIIALVKNEIRIVQAALLGSILSNLLLILGMAFLVGGLRYQEQIYNSTVTQMSACLLSLSVMSLLLPTAFHASFSNAAIDQANASTLKISRGTSVVLLLVYILYLLFQLKSHAYMYESTPQHVIDEESHPGILAEILDSSTTSDSSDSSDSTDTDTSGSHTTSRRIRKAFRNRRRRKSSVSSAQTSPLPSIISSPSQEKSLPPWDASSDTPHLRSKRHSDLGAIASGDEADTDCDQSPPARVGQPLVRDFVPRTNEDSSLKVITEMRKVKSSKRANKYKKHHRNHHETHHASHQGSSANTGEKQPHLNAPEAVELCTVDEMHAQDVHPTINATVLKKGFSIHSMPAQFRPSLPKVLSNNVFVLPPPNSQAAGAPTVSARIPTMRRTSSLPDRLNDAQAQSTSKNLPPYPRHVRVESGIKTEDSDDAENKAAMSRTSAVVLLLVSTALVAVCAEFLVDAIPAMIASTSVSQAFIGLIILPIVSNAAEHVTAVSVAARNKMDLAIGVSVGSSIQIALFLTPLVVILGWIIGREMTLYFTLFETVSLFVTAFVVNFLVLDGRSNYLEGSLLIAAYTIIALAAYFYPEAGSESSLGGGT